MSAKLKNILIIALKNGVNALLTDAGLMAAFPSVFSFHDAAGWINLAKAAGSVILAREVSVWLPLLLSWSKTSADPALSAHKLNALVPKK